MQELGRLIEIMKSIQAAAMELSICISTFQIFNEESLTVYASGCIIIKGIDEKTGGSYFWDAGFYFGNSDKLFGEM